MWTCRGQKLKLKALSTAASSAKTSGRQIADVRVKRFGKRLRVVALLDPSRRCRCAGFRRNRLTTRSAEAKRGIRLLDIRAVVFPVK
jgi:hypothetical protein